MSVNNLYGTNVSATIKPFTDADNFPTHEAIYGKGGYRSVDSIDDLTSIPLERLEEGMLAYTKDTDKIYKYVGDTTTNEFSDWIELTFSGGSGEPNMVEITYNNLVSLKFHSQLVPGTWYKIIDYECCTTKRFTRSAKHQFDIIIRADSSNELSEDAFAAHHHGLGKDYFVFCDLSAWRLKYKLLPFVNYPSDLGSAKIDFTWYDLNNMYAKNTDHPSGIIYWMRDEWGNEAPYDFKNIMFLRSRTEEGEISNNHYYDINTMEPTVNNITNYFLGKDYFWWDEENNESLSGDFSAGAFELSSRQETNVEDEDPIGNYYYTFSIINPITEGEVFDGTVGSELSSVKIRPTPSRTIPGKRFINGMNVDSEGWTICEYELPTNISVNEIKFYGSYPDNTSGFAIQLGWIDDPNNYIGEFIQFGDHNQLYTYPTSFYNEKIELNPGNNFSNNPSNLIRVNTYSGYPCYIDLYISSTNFYKLSGLYHNNIIKQYFKNPSENNIPTLDLNNIVFSFDPSSDGNMPTYYNLNTYNNYFAENCKNMTFGGGNNGLTFGPGCHSVMCGEYNNSSTIKNSDHILIAGENSNISIQGDNDSNTGKSISCGTEIHNVTINQSNDISLLTKFNNVDINCSKSIDIKSVDGNGVEINTNNVLIRNVSDKLGSSQLEFNDTTGNNYNYLQIAETKSNGQLIIYCPTDIII